MRALLKELNDFGGPGSGRHPEGKTETSGIHPDQPEVKAFMEKARESGREMENIGSKIARDLGGQVSAIDFKSASSIFRKANNYYILF